jgi:hypothetical protein
MSRNQNTLGGGGSRKGKPEETGVDMDEIKKETAVISVKCGY